MHHGVIKDNIFFPVPATIVEIPDSQEIEISSSPVFTCRGHGKPLPAVTWQTINGDPISESNTEIIEDGYFMNSTLTFNSVDRNDNGIYQCVVNNGYGDVIEDFNLTVLEVPDQVTIIIFKATNAEILELTWEVIYDGNSDIIQCGVEYMELDDQQQPVTEWMTYGTVTEIEIQYTIQLENLAAYTYYKARINCTNSQGSSVPTETVIVRTKESSSDPPRNVTLVANSESDITVIWSVPVKLNGELDYYIVYYSISSGGNTMEKQTNGIEQTIILTGLEAYTEYEIWVAAVNTVGDQSENSDKKITRTLEGVPYKTRISSFHNTSDSALTIEWDPPINPRGVTTRYELYLFLNYGASTVKTHTEPAKQSDQTYTYLFTDLLTNTEYIVEIKVCNGRRCSLTDEKSAKTSEGIPSPPLLVTTQEDINNKICTICWTEPSSPNGVLIYYRVNYSVHALSPYEGVDGHVAMEDSKGSWLVYDNTCYEYQELQTYSKYVISVQAATYAGESEPSQPPAYCQNSERSEPPISQAPVIVDDKSQTQFLMFHKQFSERNGPISCYEIIVIRIPIKKETGSLVFDTSVSPDRIYESIELNSYEDVSGIPGQAYVAVRMTRNSFQEEIFIGDGRLTECTQHSNLPVKRDIGQYSYEGEVYNGELEPETWYTVFVRAYVDNPNVDGQVFFTSSPFMEPIQTGDGGKNLEVNTND
uniref:Receptor-type tyrosine-protein phosphatase F-like n=1 Tax=Saccoglossus kowalevskii TaxID=10224 RepID=A0ABM0MXC0_SACKO|nr:PREDICTED: receptor-type tyrosine-protein phosphatase F-like [Saccoglossus kowalevskii]